MAKTNLVRTLLVLMLVCCSACSRTYSIKGKSEITSLDGKTLYLKMLADGEWKTVDSTEVEHGYFKMKGTADSIMVVTLYMNDEGIMPIVLEPGHINITISTGNLKAEGTTMNNALYEFINKRNDLQRQLIELDKKEAKLVLEGANVDEVHSQLVKESESLSKEMSEYTKTFILDNKNNVLGPSVFIMMCSTLPYPVMTPEIEDIMKTVPTSFKENRLVTEFLTKAKENMKLIEEHNRMSENIEENSRMVQNEQENQRLKLK